MIPEEIKQTLERYVNDKIPTGGFVRSVLANDLKGAFGRADINNRYALFDIVCYVVNEMPYDCQGSSILDEKNEMVDKSTGEITEKGSK